MKGTHFSACVLLFLFVLMMGVSHAEPEEAAAPTPVPAPVVLPDPRGEPELTICSQNLKNFGIERLFLARESGTTPEDYRNRIVLLTERFVRARCDVIALQELLGSNREESQQALDILINSLRVRTGRIFEGRFGPSNDRLLRLGFLVATDKADIEHLTSYADVELPKVAPEARPRLFARGPLDVQLRTKPNDEGVSKRVNVITFHFKSKYGGYGDPAGLDYETYRMEMAEALRRIVLQRHEETFTDGTRLLVLLGDRNSHFDTASAQVLYGTLELRHFQGDPQCRLGRRGVPVCLTGTSGPQVLFSPLLADLETRNLPGTFRYQNTFSWIDDILVPAPVLPFARRHPARAGRYNAGVLYEPEDASDHALLYLRLNW